MSMQVPNPALEPDDEVRTRDRTVDRRLTAAVSAGPDLHAALPADEHGGARRADIAWLVLIVVAQLAWLAAILAVVIATLRSLVL